MAYVFPFLFIIINYTLKREQNMEFINIKELQNLLMQCKDQKVLIQTFNRVNRVCRLYLKTYTPQKALQIAKKINKRVSSHSKNTQNQLVFKQINWEFGQFQVFVWIIVYHCIINNFQLHQFTDQIYIQIQKILQSRTIQYLKYQTRVLQNFITPPPDIWEKEELQILIQTLNQYPQGKDINWKMVSYSIYMRSESKYFKHINHCRQKWNNHLNPVVKRGRWSQQEDIQLFQLILKHGFRWAHISRFMNSTRTEHMVKNRYNHYLQGWKAYKYRDNSPILQMIMEIQNKQKKIVSRSSKNNELLVKIQEESLYSQEQNNNCKLEAKEPFSYDCQANIKLQESEENKEIKIIQYSNNQCKCQDNTFLNGFNVSLEQINKVFSESGV